MPNDFDFVENFYRKELAPRADKDGLNGLTSVERNIVLAWWAKGLIDNGGFASLYESPVSVRDVERAFREIGIEAAAEACANSAKLFEDGYPPTDLGERMEIVRSLHDLSHGKDPWHACDEVVWNLGDDLDSKFATYIRANIPNSSPR